MNMLSPAEIAKSTVEIGIKKSNLPVLNVLILAMLAGAYIGFAANVSTMITHDASSYIGVGLTRLLTGAIFSVGLILVVLCGAELFTGNCLLIMGVLERKISTGQMLMNWVYVFTANFFGSLIIVYIVYYSGLWAANNYLHGVAAANIAFNKVNLTFTQAFMRGILCNWLVCLAVWGAVSSKDTVGKIAVIFFIITAFVAAGFEHSIANIYFIPAGILALNMPGVIQAGGFSPEFLSMLTWQGFIIKNLLPVTLGNIVGGVFFVGMAYWTSYVKQDNPQGSMVFVPTTVKSEA